MKRTKKVCALVIMVLLVSIMTAQAKSVDPPGQDESPPGIQKNSGWTVKGDKLFTTDLNCNVGIGTMDPQYKLDVNGDARIQGTLHIGSGGTQHLIITPSGNVGIGVATPTEKLEVDGNIRTTGKVMASAYASNSPLIFEAPVGTERARIDDITGNFGIGTVSPGYRLHVIGDIGFSGVLKEGTVPWSHVSGFSGDATPDTIADDGTITLGIETTGNYDSTPDTIADDGVISDSEASDVLTIDNGLLYAPTSGSVGIGTTTPGAKLDVEVVSGGAATIGHSDNSATGNLAIALGYKTTASEEYTTAMGRGTAASGRGSMAMGWDTSASGNFSTGMGIWTTAMGESSTAMGHKTLASGRFSTAMGFQTTASGIGSTAMGYETIASGTTGSTAMGYRSIAIGETSTALGYNTNASGYISTAIGRLTEAKGEVSFATGDLTKAYGMRSTAMGYGSKASGEVSTAIGHFTTATGLVSTALGNQMTVNGNYSFGIGLGPAATITQDSTMAIMGGYVGIGTTSPSSVLHVIGKATITGGVDPPYVSYSYESHDSIRTFAQDVEDHEEVMMFWNGENHRFEVYDIKEDSFYTLTGQPVIE